MYDAERTDQKRISLSGIPKTVWQLILRHSGLGIWMLRGNGGADIYEQ